MNPLSLSNLKALTWNINGIRTADKRHLFIMEIYKNKPEFALIQDTRLNKDTLKILKNELKGYKIFATTQENQSRGCLILIKKSLNFDFLDSQLDNACNYALSELMEKL